eukprot:TRINITY_DN2894_c0_g2_i1.p3 TRINITY_DN2894_c0_g2~~TRINITY_DN2894_c0_g2_i1.p3  ORF type:complete len:101 (+),score=13.94 TRINITY_DN2894_c0_g2_i1:62-364(+)
MASVPGGGHVAAVMLGLVVCWAMVDPRRTGGDMAIAILLILSSCIGFCIWMCGLNACMSLVQVAVSGTRPQELLHNAAEQGAEAQREAQREHEEERSSML